MTLTLEAKTKVIKKHQIHKKDTGSADVQIAVLTERINTLASHWLFRKDHNSAAALEMIGSPHSLSIINNHRTLLEDNWDLNIRK